MSASELKGDKRSTLWETCRPNRRSSAGALTASRVHSAANSWPSTLRFYNYTNLDDLCDPQKFLTVYRTLA